MVRVGARLDDAARACDAQILSDISIPLLCNLTFVIVTGVFSYPAGVPSLQVTDVFSRKCNFMS